MTVGVRTPLVELVTFDIAGTTVRDDGLVMRAFRRVADEHQLARDDQWMKARMGVDKRQVFREALVLAGRNGERALELAHRFDECIASELWERPPRALPGAELCIRELTDLRVRIAFTTGFSTNVAEMILDRMGWGHFVRVASDQVSHGRPAPDLIRECMRRSGVTDVARVAACGDTPSDLGAGTNAGCRFVVGVGHGTHSLAELEVHPHTHLLPDLTNFVEVICG